jgi:hypothetical protein
VPPQAVRWIVAVLVGTPSTVRLPRQEVLENQYAASIATMTLLEMTVNTLVELMVLESLYAASTARTTLLETTVKILLVDSTEELISRLKM